MKNLGIVLSFLTDPSRRRNVITLLKLLASFFVTILVFSIIFHYLMELEGQQHSWATAFYWVLVVMSTLGFGDITFTSDRSAVFDNRPGDGIVIYVGSVAIRIYSICLCPLDGIAGGACA